MDNYDLVLEYLLSEGYSHKEATSIMVNEGIIQDLWKAAQKRFSSPKNIARAGAADVAATAIASTPANAARPALPPQPAPIVRTVAAPVTPNPLQQVAAPFKKIRNIVRQLNPAKSAAGSLPQGKPGGSLGNVVNTRVVKPNVNTGNLASANPKGSSVSTGSGGGVTTTSGGGVTKPTSRTPGGPLAKAGPVVDVKPVRPLSGSTSSTPVGGSSSVARIPAPKPQPLSFSGLLKRLPKPSGGGVGPLSGSGGNVVSAAISLLAQPVINKVAERGSKELGKLSYRLQGKENKAQQIIPSLYDKQGPDLTKNIVSGVINRERPEVSGVGPLSRVAQPYNPPRPEASKTPEKKPEVKQVVTKKKVVTPVVKKPAPAKPVDPRLQKYRDLVKKGKRLEAETLGREIYQSTYGAPAFRPTKTA